MLVVVDVDVEVKVAPWEPGTVGTTKRVPSLYPADFKLAVSRYCLVASACTAMASALFGRYVRSIEATAPLAVLPFAVLPFHSEE